MPGPAGRIESVLEFPQGPAQGLALIGHPHPLYGGTMENKVVATVARAFLSLGWITARPNFRGVGASEGVHDQGHGETEDLVFLADALAAMPQCAAVLPPLPPLALAGFSFGSYVAAGAALALAAQGRPASALVLIGTAAGKWPVPSVDAASLVIHGEIDETIPLADVFTWARASNVPVVVLPGADHFFHRRLPQLKLLVQRHLLGAAQLARGAGARGADD